MASRLCQNPVYDSGKVCETAANTWVQKRLMHDNGARAQRAGKAATTIDKRMDSYNVFGMSMGRNRSRDTMFRKCSLVDHNCFKDFFLLRTLQLID